MFWISHSREVHHSEKYFHCVFNKPVQFKILVVIIRISIREFTTYNPRLIFRLLPIVSLVYSGVSHITVGETITKPYAIAAAVGSLMIRRMFIPEMVPASLVA